MSMLTRTACLLASLSALSLPSMAQAWSLYGDRPHPSSHPAGAYPGADQGAAPGQSIAGPGRYGAGGPVPREYPGDSTAYRGEYSRSYRGDYAAGYPGEYPYPGDFSPGAYPGGYAGPYGSGPGGAHGPDLGGPFGNPWGMGPGRYPYPDVPTGIWGATPPYQGYGYQRGPRPGVPQTMSPELGGPAEFRLSRRATDDAYLLDIELEGMGPEEILVQGQGRWLLISRDLSRQDTREDQLDSGYLHSFRYASGTVRRRLSVPPDANLDALTRENRGHSIHIRIPRRPAG